MSQPLAPIAEGYERVVREIMTPRTPRAPSGVRQLVMSPTSSDSICSLRRAGYLAAASMVGFLALLATLAVLARTGMGPVSFGPSGAMQLVGEVGDVCKRNISGQSGALLFRSSLDFTLVAKGTQDSTVGDGYVGQRTERIARTQEQFNASTIDDVRAVGPHRFRGAGCREGLVCQTSDGHYFGRCAAPSPSPDPSPDPSAPATAALSPAGTISSSPSATGGPAMSPELQSAVQNAVNEVLSRENPQ